MLIHKTMTMPTSCLSCWISATCDVWVAEKKRYKGYDNRLVNCPLEEVKHGHWINTNEGIWNTVDVLKCSVCGEIDNRMYRSDAYCPYCGAKMDEVEE